MIRVGIASGRRLPLALAALAASLVWMLLLFSGAASASSVPSSCPSVSTLKSAAGESLTRVESAVVKGAGLCVYTGAKASSLTFELIPLKGIDSAIFNEILKQAEEKDKAIQVKAVSGLSNAVEFVEDKGARQSDGYPDIVITAYTDNTEVVIGSDLPLSNVVKVAHQLL